MPLVAEREQIITAARLAGAWAFGVVAQIAVHMPQGYLGGRDQITGVGAAYAAVLTLLVVLLMVALYRRLPVVSWLVPLVFSANVALFIPAMATDPFVSGAVVIWNLTLLAQQIFPARPLLSPLRFAVSDRERWLQRFSTAARHLGLASLLLTVAVVGYRLSGRPVAQLVCLILGYLALVVVAPFLRLLYREGNRAIPFLITLLAAGGAWSFVRPEVGLSLLAVAEASVLVVLLAQEQSTMEIVRHFYAHPSRLLVASFFAMIVLGTMLLTFPASSGHETPLAPLDAWFTATSAVCVTGLSVLDPPHDLSPFGQGILLALIQIGGLGIMTLSTFATLMLGGRLGLRGEQALTAMLEIHTGPAAYRLTRFIVLSTVATEAAGALGLTFYYDRAGLPLGEALWRGLFHSVSAFCNAGFALQSDNLVMFQSEPGALLLIGALITLGGLGFPVLAGLWGRLAAKHRRPLTVHVQVVLSAAVVLVISGTLLYLLLEWRRSLAGLSVLDKAVNALFQSITLRTAGFNSVDFAPLAPATILFMMLFMFIGGAPGSTAGGIKTTTAVLLLAALRSTVRGPRPVRLFDRQVPAEVVLRAIAIIVSSASVILVGLFLLLLFEPHPFVSLSFETFSAFGTVGLTLGLTPKLGAAGKLIIIATMFAGRVGPLTLTLLLARSDSRAPICDYPEERLMVG